MPNGRNSKWDAGDGVGHLSLYDCEAILPIKTGGPCLVSLGPMDIGIKMTERRSHGR